MKRISLVLLCFLVSVCHAQEERVEVHLDVRIKPSAQSGYEPTQDLLGCLIKRIHASEQFTSSFPLFEQPYILQVIGEVLETSDQFVWTEATIFFKVEDPSVRPPYRRGPNITATGNRFENGMDGACKAYANWLFDTLEKQE